MLTLFSAFFAACGLSFFCSMAGVSGAFLLLPMQICLFGAAGPQASATNHFFNLMATPAGVMRYLREGRMLWPLALLLCAGTVPGLFVGVWLRMRCLPGQTAFSIFAALVLFFLGCNMLRPARVAAGRTAAQTAARTAAGDFHIHDVKLSATSLTYTFNGQRCLVPVQSLLCVSSIVGIVGGAYGIGGGAIMSPFLISVLRLPVHSFSAATLFCTFCTSCAALPLYCLGVGSSGTLLTAPDWPLAISLGLGGMTGMYFGARRQRRVSGAFLKKMICVLTFTAGAAMLARALV